MTNTTTETLTVDGVVLNTLAKNITSLAGRLRTPPVRTNNIVVPNRHGVLRTPRKWFDANVLQLPMWVLGCADDGSIPTTSRTEFYKRVDELTALFSSPEPLLVQHTLPDASVRECLAEVLEVLDFTTSGINPVGMFSVALNVYGAFWRDNSDKTFSLTNPTVPGTISLTQFAGATAPMDDLIITITGPITNPRVEAYRNGLPLSQPVVFQYTGAIASGQTLILNCGTWQMSGTAGATFANLSHSGDARWLSIPAAPGAGTPQIRLSGSGNSAVTAISVVGRRKFLVG